MAFNPLIERGIPIERQLRNWSDLNVQPFDKDNVDPYTRTRVIALNGIEVEAAFFSHQFARHTDNLELRRALALTRRIEQQQQKAVNWLLPGDASPLETTIAYEQVAVDLTAYMGRVEKDPYIKQAFDFGVLEDFDHLYRYANLMDLLEGKKAEAIVQQLTEVMPGRPTVLEHRHPHDDVRRGFEHDKGDPLSLLHVLTITAAEQQTMNFYMTIGNLPTEPLARGLYAEIAQIEEQHVTHYESLLDARLSWLQQEVLHQYNECYVYYSFMQQESDARIKRLWELHLNMELEHLRIACELLRRHEGREPEEFLPKEIPEPARFESNREYVRDLLAAQVQLTCDGTEYIAVDDLPADHRYFSYQETVNKGAVPSEDSVQAHIEKLGAEYRSQPLGPHPVERLRESGLTPPDARGPRRGREVRVEGAGAEEGQPPSPAP